MTGGFSFCGTDIADLKLEYAPELSDTYVYAPGETTVQEQTFDAHNGGYFYGVTRQPKQIILRCFFEEQYIDRGIMAKVYHLFRVGKQGKLVFQRRPWCYYYATVIDCVPEYSNYMNGLIKITMKAYYPYARSDMLFCERDDVDYARVMSNTAMPSEQQMLPVTEICKSTPLVLGSSTDRKIVYLLNPGTERAAIGIQIGGIANQGLKFTNLTTDQICSFSAMTTENTNRGFVYLDGISGKTSLITGSNNILKMMFHDSGFIELEPGFPAVRNLLVKVTNENAEVDSHGIDGITVLGAKKAYTMNVLYDENKGDIRADFQHLYAGRHIWTNGMWREVYCIYDAHTLCVGPDIVPNDNNNLSIDTHTTPSAGYEPSFVTTLNKIVISAVDTATLTTLNFLYKPTFA